MMMDIDHMMTVEADSRAGRRSAVGSCMGSGSSFSGATLRPSPKSYNINVIRFLSERVREQSDWKPVHFEVLW